MDRENREREDLSPYEQGTMYQQALDAGLFPSQRRLAEQLGVNEAEIKNESSFVDDLGADSLDTVELVMALEDEFGTEIPDEQAEKITTVQQAIDFVSANQKAA